jgi:AraC-like DNA-binding protein
MHSTLSKANKFLLIEKSRLSYLSPDCLPVEYMKLLLPFAGVNFRQDAECEILSQHIPAGPFSLWLRDVLAKDNIVLCPYTNDPILSLTYVFEDNLPQLAERECQLFYLQPGVYHLPMTAGKKILAVHINLLPASLPALSAKYPALAALQSGGPYHINAVCDSLIKQILSCRYTGDHAQRFIYRCCLNLFQNFAEQHATDNQLLLFTNMLQMDAYLQLFSHLVKHPHTSHFLSELAHTFNITSSELANGFKQHFNISIEDFMHMQQMIHTYQLLQNKFWSPEIIAEKAGFINVNEMTRHIESYYECKIEELRS